MEDGLGVKRAAVRKLGHELGIDARELPLSNFTFLTRVHYKAQCPDPKWGEHEVDHILVFRAPADIAVKPNPEEVAEVPTPFYFLGCHSPHHRLYLHNSPLDACIIVLTTYFLLIISSGTLGQQGTLGRNG